MAIYTLTLALPRNLAKLWLAGHPSIRERGVTLTALRIYLLGVDRILSPRIYPWTPWEDDIIMQAADAAWSAGASGPSWIGVAKELPGRTDSLVRDRYMQLNDATDAVSNPLARQYGGSRSAGRYPLQGTVWIAAYAIITAHHIANEFRSFFLLPKLSYPINHAGDPAGEDTTQQLHNNPNVYDSFQQHQPYQRHQHQQQQQQQHHHHHHQQQQQHPGSQQQLHSPTHRRPFMSPAEAPSYQLQQMRESPQRRSPYHRDPRSGISVDGIEGNTTGVSTGMNIVAFCFGDSRCINAG